MKASRVDITGLGENAVDHVLRLSEFPAPDGKVNIESATQRLGGQIATAVVACRTWGLTARYIGSCGDDGNADLHEAEFARLGIEAQLIRARDTVSRLSYILVDRKSGSRAVLGRRALQLRITPKQLASHWVTNSRLLHIDAENPQASLAAARWARKAGVAVMCDFDSSGPAVETLLRAVDYPVLSGQLVRELAKQRPLLAALPFLQKRFSSRLISATLGEGGAVAWDGKRFWYAAAFRVQAVDTTGAGDLFHAGFAYGVLQGWGWQRVLDFACAAAGLNCTAEGARGRIGKLAEIEKLRRTGKRHGPAFAAKELRAAEADEGRG